MNRPRSAPSSRTGRGAVRSSLSPPRRRTGRRGGPIADEDLGASRRPPGRPSFRRRLHVLPRRPGRGTRRLRVPAGAPRVNGRPHLRDGSRLREGLPRWCSPASMAGERRTPADEVSRGTEVRTVIPDNTHSFVGRQAELAAAAGRARDRPLGPAPVVLLEGPPGIGKTAVLDRLLDDESDLTVLRATGEQWEAFVAYGVVDQLMRVAGVSAARLRAGRDRSLPAEEPVGVGARILEALAELEQKAPVVIVVDDAQWADIDSLRALLFVARRLVRERVLLVLAQRTEDAMRLPEGLSRLATGRTGTTIALQPLTGEELQRLAAGSRRAPALRTDRPPPAGAHGWQPALHHHVADRDCPRSAGAPGSRCCRPHARSRCRSRAGSTSCSPETRGLVEAAAVLGVHASLASAAALADVEDVVSAVDEAVDVGLVQIRDDGLRDVGFAHPLVRAAIYEQLGPARRVRLHSRAAGLVDDEGAALRHRVLAAAPPDPGLADEARGLRAAGGPGRGVGRCGLDPPRGEPAERRPRAAGAPAAAGRRRDDRCRRPHPGRLVRAAGRGGSPRGRCATRRWATSPCCAGAPVKRKLCCTPRGSSARPRGRSRRRRRRRAAVGAARGGAAAGRGGGGVGAAGAGRSPRPDDPVRVEAEALLGLGLGWQGRLQEGLAAYEAVLARSARRLRGAGGARPDGPGLAVPGRGRPRDGAGPARPGRARRACARGRSGSRCGRTCGWRGRGSRWGRGMRRRRMRSGRCRCWRSRGMSGCGRWRGVWR